MKNIKDLIGEKLYNVIFSKFDESQVEEIRVRANCPLVVCTGGKNFIVSVSSGDYIISDDDINHIIAAATENSMYAVQDQIKQMYISYYGGIRIGITGDIVEENGKIITVKYINSLNIRLPHEIKNFSNIAMNFIHSGGIKSTLIVSEPGAGKTTLIRDIARNLSHCGKIYNVLLVDERKEIAYCNNGRPTLDVGSFTDIISGGNKSFAFNYAIRSLKPNVIITDELSSKEDYLAAEKAILSGVKVIASVHAKNQLDAYTNENIKHMLDNNFFERIIVLSEKAPNRYQGVYDNKLKCLYMPY